MSELSLPTGSRRTRRSSQLLQQAVPAISAPLDDSVTSAKEGEAHPRVHQPPAVFSTMQTFMQNKMLEVQALVLLPRWEGR